MEKKNGHKVVQAQVKGIQMANKHIKHLFWEMQTKP